MPEYEPSEGTPQQPDTDELGGDPEISIQVDEEFSGQVDPVDLARAVRAALTAEDARGELTVLVTTDAAVQDLNRHYRGIDEPTDVLSFGAEDDGSGFVTAPEAAEYLGDIAIAYPFTLRQAQALNRSLRSEMRLLAVHGTLHLLGYDHLEAEDEAAMWARQDAILAGLSD